MLFLVYKLFDDLFEHSKLTPSLVSFCHILCTAWFLLDVLNKIYSIGTIHVTEKTSETAVT